MNDNTNLVFFRNRNRGHFMKGPVVIKDSSHGIEKGDRTNQTVSQPFEEKEPVVDGSGNVDANRPREQPTELN